MSLPYNNSAMIYEPIMTLQECADAELGVPNMSNSLLAYNSKLERFENEEGNPVFDNVTLLRHFAAKLEYTETFRNLLNRAAWEIESLRAAIAKATQP